MLSDTPAATDSGPVRISISPVGGGVCHWSAASEAAAKPSAQDDGCDATEVDVGLSTSQALLQLCSDVTAELRRYRCCSDWSQAVCAVWQRRAQHSWSCWLLGCTTVLLLLTADALDAGSPAAHLWIEALAVLLLTSSTVVLAVWLERMSSAELYWKAERLVDRIQRMSESGECCKPDAYPHLHAPTSPCISLQWTYRDGQLVNLPASLLTVGDVVLLRPGETALADMQDTEDDVSSLRLRRLEMFTPAETKLYEERAYQPRLVPALSCRRFRVLNTPYVESLAQILQEGTRRPPPQLALQMSAVLRPLLLTGSIISFTVCLVGIVLQYYLLDLPPGGSDDFASLAEEFATRSALCLLPLLPLVIRPVLLVASWWGAAHLTSLTASTAAPEDGQRQRRQQLDLLDEPSVQVERTPVTCPLAWRGLRRIVLARCDSLPHTAGLLHAFGTLSSLCCVDKQGVLSWPIPTVEKVVTLKLNDDECAPATDGHDQNATTRPGETPTNQKEGHLVNFAAVDGDGMSLLDADPGTSDASLDVLNLTPDTPAEPWTLQFDDPGWRRSLARLKPLGLSSLVNTCNVATVASSRRFARHLSCLSRGHACLAPLSIRYCLCRLARQIGFTEQAANGFHTESHLACYKRQDPDQTRRDRLTHVMSLSRARTHFPNMSGVVLRDPFTGGSLQLMSQGSADMVLDTCCEFWDGRSVVPLVEQDRRRLLDFYHRHSLTVHCLAFSYRPLTAGVSSRLADWFLELPAESRRPSNRISHSLAVAEPALNPQYMSTDSLYGGSALGETVDNAEALVQTVSSQIFLGMATMQYQVLADVVVLIDQLEAACIRFVHFSKENELRSRVFSEKMGLESGWNCHISLLDEHLVDSVASTRSQLSPSSIGAGGCCGVDCLSRLEKQRPLSASAPSVVNLSNKSDAALDEKMSLLADCEDNETAGGGSRGSECVCAGSRMVTAASRSPSNTTDSTDQSAQLNFDISNRARLPKGIAQIRPHLECVDNVPLQVSLFTDCTPDTTCQMLRIMQDYGEVVCVLGSSANALNVSPFLCADAAVALRPLSPQLCLTSPTTDDAHCESPDSATSRVDHSLLSSSSSRRLTQLAERLDTLPCSLRLRRREDCATLTQLVMESRHWTERLRAAFVFWMGASCATVCLHAVAVLLLLPAPLSLAQTMWCSWVQVTILCGALLLSPPDAAVMSEAQDRAVPPLTAARFSYICWCHGLRFLPSSLALLLFWALALRRLCVGACTRPEPSHRALLQAVVLLLHALCLTVTSAGYVHRRALLLRRPPCSSWAWNMAAVVSLMAAAMFALLHGWTVGAAWSALSVLLPYLAVAGLAWPILQLAINELVKHYEFKYRIRAQKRARLEFDTKLGMNSPF